MREVEGRKLPLMRLSLPEGAIAMSSKEILEKALKLKPQERFLVIEGLIRSLDEPDKRLDDIWAEEAERRLAAYREGKLELQDAIAFYELELPGLGKQFKEEVRKSISRLVTYPQAWSVERGEVRKCLLHRFP